MRDDEDIDNLLFNPYDYKEMDKEDIQMRLDLLVPSNMWVIL